MKVPKGRSGDCKPARETRTALETTASASSCPTTVLARLASMSRRRSRSAATSRVAGIPVARDTTSAMWAGVTCSESRVSSFWFSPLEPPAAWLHCENSFSSLGMMEYLSSPALTKSPSRSATPSSARACCKLLRASLRCSKAERSADHAAFNFSTSACLAWSDSRRVARRASTCTPDSRLSASSSICMVSTSRSRSAMGSGLDSCCIRSRLAASSSRSMAESGSRRSTMYRCAWVTADTSAASVMCTP
mmetsp:Transcript_31459/g.96224  ORF Transcript_31459/g.96224 Transcript_31459/m.96224 type:complete len:249 (+) Transcript_31459:1053-1799(+)